MIDIEAACRRYLTVFGALSPQTLDALEEICAPDVHFRDPFNDTHTVADFRRALEKGFEDVAEMRFQVRDHALSGRTLYIRWDCHLKPRPTSTDWLIEGMSEVQFDERGLVAAHVDHWDCGRQFYEKIPVLGFFVRQVRKRLAI